MTTPDRPRPLRRTTRPIPALDALTRRRFLRGLGVLGVGTVLGPSLLPACGGDDGDRDDASGTTGAAGDGQSLTISNWIAYIDDETEASFEGATGIALSYTEDYNDNDEYFAKIQPLLSAGDPIEADIIVPTYWLVRRLIDLGWVEPLPLASVPNAANLLPTLQRPSWDPEGRYSLPWQTGITGIAYNRDIAGRDIASVADLLDPAFRGRVGMLTEMRDTIGLLMLATGADPANPTFDAAADAFDRLEQAVADGQVRQFTGNDYMDDLASGNYAACIGWSGDVAQLALDNPAIGFVIPEEGGLLFSDSMVIPTGSPHAAAAARWMDFVYDPVNAARITAEVQYISPVAGVRDALVALGPEAAALAESPLLFPDAATSARLRTFGALSEDEEVRFDERFAEITGV